MVSVKDLRRNESRVAKRSLVLILAIEPSARVRETATAVPSKESVHDGSTISP